MYLLEEKTVPENKKDRKSAREIWLGERGMGEKERGGEIFFSLDGSMLVEKKIS